MIALLFVLGCFDDAAQAGTLYREALEALRGKRYDDVVARLQEALRAEARETDKLLYRDREGRHGEPYYPHYVWAQARILQSRGETHPPLRREQLREALLHLGLTEHPDAAAMLARAKSELADLEKLASSPAPPEAALTDLRHRIANLCDQERFGESLQLLVQESGRIDLSPGDRAQLAETIDERRSTVIARYERAMSLALETIAAASPLDRPDAIPSMIQPVLPPASVVEKPGARFLWLREFQALFQRELPLLRNPNEANGPTLLQSARAFEQCALAACNADSFAGFRAAANIADSIRESRVARIKDGHDDAELDQFLADWEQSLKGRESILSRNPAPADEIDPFRAGVLLPRAAALQKIRERKEARSRLRNEVDRWISRAGALLEDPATMADPVPLHAAAEQGSLLEDSGVWTEIASGPRSEAFFLHGLLELAAGMLENSPPERLRERASRLIRDARSLNPEIVTPWKEKLSPKIMSWLEGLPR